MATMITEERFQSIVTKLAREGVDEDTILRVTRAFGVQVAAPRRLPTIPRGTIAATDASLLLLVAATEDPLSTNFEYEVHMLEADETLRDVGTWELVSHGKLDTQGQLANAIRDAVEEYVNNADLEVLLAGNWR